MMNTQPVDRCSKVPAPPLFVSRLHFFFGLRALSRHVVTRVGSEVGSDQAVSSQRAKSGPIGEVSLWRGRLSRVIPIPRLAPRALIQSVDVEGDRPDQLERLGRISPSSPLQFGVGNRKHSRSSPRNRRSPPAGPPRRDHSTATPTAPPRPQTRG